MSEQTSSPPPDLFPQIAEQMGFVLWSVDARDSSLEYLSPRAESLFGRPVDDFHADPGLWLAMVHPEDHGAVASSQDTLLLLGQVERRYRILHADGRVVWLHDSVKVMRDGAGRARRLAGIVKDVTAEEEERRRRDDELALYRRAVRGSSDAIFRLVHDDDGEFRFLETNPAYQAATGLSLAEVLHHTPHEVLAPVQADEMVRHCRACAASGQTTQYEERLAHEGGGHDWQVLLVPIQGRDGCFEELVGIGRDISTLRDAERRLRASRDHLDRLLLTSPVVIFTCEATEALTPTYISPGLHRLLGYRRDELLGRAHWRNLLVHPEDRDASHPRVKHMLVNGGSIQLRSRVRHQGGDYRWIQSEMRLLTDDEGRAREVVGALLDINEVHEATRRLEKLSEQLPGFVYQYQLGPDGHGWFPYASPHSRDIYGASPDVLRDSDGPALEVIHPNDLDRVVASIQASAESLSHWQCEYRVSHPRGHELWVSGLATPECLSNGAILWHGFIADITVHKQAQLKLEASERRYRRITENISDLLCLHAANQKAAYRFVSPSVTRLLGYRQEELLGRSPYDFLHPEDIDRVDQLSHQGALRGEAEAEVEYRFRHRDGHYVWLQTSIIPVTSHDGTVIALQTLSRDVTERRRAKAELERLSTTDALTGAPNRRHFLERLYAELQRQARHGQAMSVVMFDIDHFKRVNDRWGHAAGDAVLKRLVSTAQSLLRAQDLLGRLGGEEFAVMLPEADVDGAARFAERLRVAIEALRIDHGETMIAVTISLGLTTTSGADTPERVLERADGALYAAKHEGRNQWRCR
ncbi:sensor domain-containing diguanylate cyclase [Halomonas nitroreducens]|uniref:Sensor domain-containing diguanylate cyclase n=1 Tax=Halomonas nitroreducens TaxID=447425 RepID=A0A431V6X8_9GAMM|nr:sensor domain-containing diguanylate cyclase [Halomonas nitroreducens]RTR06484.1 sensor domain-containing diguanylate cyclase [Halomonas nitroreducens]